MMDANDKIEAAKKVVESLNQMQMDIIDLQNQVRELKQDRSKIDLDSIQMGPAGKRIKVYFDAKNDTKEDIESKIANMGFAILKLESELKK